MKTLVLNCGSSSIKYKLFDMTSGEVMAQGGIEKVGLPDSFLKFTDKNGEKVILEKSIPDHTVGIAFILDTLTDAKHGCLKNFKDINAVGHRVVHGGVLFSQPVIITDEVLGMVRDLIPLAPLHNPANIDGIEVARNLLSDVPHVAVFDTGFFSTVPPAAAVYAINAEVAAEHGVRRYGFHGTSHEYVSQHIPELLGKPADEVNQITLHLGNGASASAIRGGMAVDTSMGMTPLAGLVMGTRSGDVDPGIIFHLHRSAGMSIDEIDQLLNRSSGVKGISGVNDFRELDQLIEQGDQDAWLAYNIYIHQLRRYIGSYMVALGRVDAITFTAGVGENAPNVRADALANLEQLGIKIDPERNSLPNNGAREISTDDSKIKVFVVPTNEELAIARYAMKLAAEA